ncbi:MAG: DUF4389 domain-containing protein [bacterium]
MDYPIELHISSEEAASRVELLVRFPYIAALGFILRFWGFFIVALSVAQALHILILGRRNRQIWRYYRAFLIFNVRVDAYRGMLTDRRPPITGKDGIIAIHRM